MIELAIELKADAGSCLYRQIYEYIKQEIRTGKLQRNERLPSTRSLAEHLQVARSTVDAAYSQLLAEGYIESRPYRGYFVCSIDNVLDLTEAGNTAGRRADRIPDRGLGDSVMAQKGKESEKQQKIIYDFSPYAISMKDFPFATWKKITKDILVDANSEMFALGDAQGDYELRRTIGRYLHSARGVNCEPEQIIVGAGHDYLLMLLEKILGRQRTVAMENPTYLRAYRMFCSFHYGIELLPMDENGMREDALFASGADIAYVMPSHQYPTGVVMPIGRRLELLRWAEQNADRYLIEDDYDSEFRYKGKPIPALQASDRNGKVIYMGTFSKSIAPAIRVAYMVLPQALLKQYKELFAFHASTVSRIDQRILNEFIADGYFERYLNKMRKIYKEKHDYLLEEMKEFEHAFLFSGENAGLHILLTSKKNVTAKELIRAAEDVGIKAYGIAEASSEQGALNKQYQSTVILGYGALQKDDINRGITLLKEAWKEYL